MDAQIHLPTGPSKTTTVTGGAGDVSAGHPGGGLSGRVLMDIQISHGPAAGGTVLVLLSPNEALNLIQLLTLGAGDALCADLRAQNRPTDPRVQGQGLEAQSGQPGPSQTGYRPTGQPGPAELDTDLGL